MFSRLLTSFMVLSIASVGVAHARVCYVSDFDTRGCVKGDELLYMPERWGNEQHPIEFIAKKCDFTKEIAWTKGGVTCVYAGPKDLVEAKDEVRRIAYSGIYNKVAKNPDGWYKADDGRFWKVVQKGTEGPMKTGDKVVLAYQSCEHDMGGREQASGEFVPDGEIEALTENHYVFMAQPEPTYGSIIEIVGPTQHGFVKVEKKKVRAKVQSKAKAKL